MNTSNRCDFSQVPVGSYAIEWSTGRRPWIGVELLNERPWEALNFFISSGAGTLINNNRKGNYTVKIHQGCRCAYSRQLWKGTCLVSQYNTNSWCSKTQLSPNRLWCRTESLSLIASGLCVCNAVVIHRVPTHPWKSLTVLDLCS